MSVPLYMDHHVSSAVTAGLRRRGVDVMIAYDNGHAEAEDETVLQRTTALGRLLFTQDEDLLAIASRWRRVCRQFAGVVFASQGSLTTGETIEWLELIAKASTPQELFNSVQFIPLR